MSTAAVASDVSACNVARGQASINACGRVLAAGGDAERLGIAHFKRGLAFSRNGDNRRALADFEVAARLRPNDADAQQNVAATKMRLGDEAGAREELRRQAQSGPNADRAGRASRVLNGLDRIDAQLDQERRELEAEMHSSGRKARSSRLGFAVAPLNACLQSKANSLSARSIMTPYANSPRQLVERIAPNFVPNGRASFAATASILRGAGKSRDGENSARDHVG